jgi:hypothetical protein
MFLKASTSDCSRRKLRREDVEHLVKGIDHVDSQREKALADSVIGRPHIEADRLDLSTEM